MTLACDSEFIRALAIGLVSGFAFGFVSCALLTLDRIKENGQ